MLIKYIILILAIFVSWTNVQAQEVYEESPEIWRAKVVEIISDEARQLPGLPVEARVQELRAELLDGPQASETIILENDFSPLKVGDKFFLARVITVDGDELYHFREPDRRGILLFFALIFVAVVLFFGRWRGLRSLVALTGSFLILFYFLFPQLIAGVSPMLVSSLFAIAILIFAIYTTHGFNWESSAALFGTIVTVLITIVFANLAVSLTKLSGFSEEASVYLNIHTGGTLDFRGLLLGAIIIGVLGILDDVAITQAATVKELNIAAPHLSRKEVYRRALRVGQEHVGGMVNTLALAYAGVALPLLLFFYHAEASLLLLNREIFATEIIRTIVGSTSIILAVPITTLIATILLVARGEKK